MASPLQVRDEITQQIEQQVEAMILGQVATSELLVRAEQAIRRIYSQMLDIPESVIAIRNLRYEDEGRTVAWDGIQLQLGLFDSDDDTAEFITPPMDIARADEAIRSGRTVYWDFNSKEWDYGDG
jgi:hypothetical protein